MPRPIIDSCLVAERVCQIRRKLHRRAGQPLRKHLPRQQLRRSARGFCKPCPASSQYNHQMRCFGGLEGLACSGLHSSCESLIAPRNFSMPVTLHHSVPYACACADVNPSEKYFSACTSDSGQRTQKDVASLRSKSVTCNQVYDCCPPHRLVQKSIMQSSFTLLCCTGIIGVYGLFPEARVFT